MLIYLCGSGSKGQSQTYLLTTTIPYSSLPLPTLFKATNDSGFEITLQLIHSQNISEFSSNYYNFKYFSTTAATFMNGAKQRIRIT